MSNLSNGLRKYYKRHNAKKIIFINKQTLNQLSLQMWEMFKYKQIDSSVISRVINGERLFTPSQLKIFCEILNLKNQEEEQLLLYLSKDYAERYNIDLEAFFVPKIKHMELIQYLIDEVKNAVYKGRASEVIRTCKKVEHATDYLMNTPLSENNRKEIHKLIALILYIKMKSLGAFLAPQDAISKTLDSSNRLFSLNKQYNDQTMWCYAHILLAHAYYISGETSGSKKSKNSYTKAIEHANKVLPYLPIDNRERIFALRLISASASYTRDEEVINFSFMEFNKILANQPKENDISMYLLAGNLAEGTAILQKPEPFFYKDKVVNHFGDIILDGNIHETSAIKRDIETYVALGSSDKQTISNLAKKGLILANKYDYPRHQKYLNKVISTL